MEYYEQLFRTICDDCKVRQHKMNYLHFLEAVVVLQQKSLELNMDAPRTLFMRLLSGNTNVEEPNKTDEPEWEQLTLWDIINEGIT